MVREDDLRATFSALHAEGAPPRAITAADLIQRGRTVRTRRRTIAVVGTGLATVGVVAVALAVLPPATPPEPLVPGPSTTTSTPQPTPPSSPSSVESTPSTTPSAPYVTESQGPPPVQTTTSPGASMSDPPRVTSPQTSINPTSSAVHPESMPPTSR